MARTRIGYILRLSKSLAVFSPFRNNRFFMYMRSVYDIEGEGARFRAAAADIEDLV